MKAVVTDYIEEDLNWEAEQLKAAGIEFEAFQLKFKPEDEVVAAVADTDMIVVNMVKITDSLLARLPKCKLIIRHGIGYDNVDVAACTKRGIQFAYQPDYCKEDVAEHAVALLLACARKLFPARRTLEESSKAGQWDFSKLFPIARGAGKTVGVLGVGRIGSIVCRKLKGFGFVLQGCDPLLSEKRKADVGIPFTDSETLFRTSDFVTIHTALNDETRGLVNEKSLSWMKPTAYLINTARAGMIDTAALVQALKQKQIAGAAIDVFDVEPPPITLPLFEMENVILTPHIGWASTEAGEEIRKSILDDLLAFAQGRPARCVVNKEVLNKT